MLKKYMRISDQLVIEDGYRYAVTFFQQRPHPTLDEVRAVIDEYKSLRRRQAPRLSSLSI